MPAVIEHWGFNEKPFPKSAAIPIPIPIPMGSVMNPKICFDRTLTK
jgi:hypothetical protein